MFSIHHDHTTETKLKLLTYKHSKIWWGWERSVRPLKKLIIDSKPCQTTHLSANTALSASPDKKKPIPDIYFSIYFREIVAKCRHCWNYKLGVLTSIELIILQFHRFSSLVLITLWWSRYSSRSINLYLDIFVYFALILCHFLYHYVLLEYSGYSDIK